MESPLNNKESINIPETNIDAVIKDSKSVLSKKEPKKGKRGRPPGSSKRPDADQTIPKAESAKAPETVYVPGPMVPAFKEVWKLAFRVPADKYKCPEARLTDEEAEAPAIATDQVLNAFTPDLNALSPKATACVQFVVVVGMLFISKRMIINEHRERTEPKIERPGPDSNKRSFEASEPDTLELREPKPEPEPWGPPPTGGVQTSADALFRGRNKLI